MRSSAAVSSSLLLLLLLIFPVVAEYAMYDCPLGWEDSDEFCYRFEQEDVTLNDAKQKCLELGDFTYVLSINSELEHNFVYNMLHDKYDTGGRKRDWWTSGRRLSGKRFMEFYWEGDGTLIESYFYWLNDTIPAQTDKSVILYHYDGERWGWILGYGTEKRPFICKISKEDIYHISDTARGPDYGIEETDDQKVPRGPRMVQQPTDVLFEISVLEVDEDLREDYAAFDCVASAFPAPSYSWYKDRMDHEDLIDPAENERYTLIGGRLVIDQVSEKEGDNGVYWCKATNRFGAILSNRVLLEFGVIGDFTRDDRSPVVALSYREAIIECSPPKPTPDGSMLSFEWYKDDTNNFVRPQLKPYIFISWDGKLYFSEVTIDDAGLYYCKVSRTGTIAGSGAISPAIGLEIQEASPGEHEPKILSGFPAFFPQGPLVGEDVRIECFAAGSSDPPLIYTWEKVEKGAGPGGSDRVVPLTSRAYLEDHNRVLNIRNVQLYDSGTYRCNASRLYGQRASKEAPLTVKWEDVLCSQEALPFFIVGLEDQFLDEGATLRWRCQADGVPGPDYYWLRNGQKLTNGSIDHPDRITVSNNVLIITNAQADIHNAMYQCAAKNVYGIRYSSAELRVISFAPTFAKMPLPANQFATEEGNTTLLCRPEAAPKPEITWYKNGGIISPGTEESRVRQMANGNLYISRVQTSDAGTYTCKAVNSLGDASTTGNLTVLDTVTLAYRPELPPGVVKVNRTVFIHCIASYNPKLDVTYVWFQGDMLIEFDKVYRLGENKYEVWHDPHFKGGSGHFNGGLYLMNVQYRHSGKYTCRVESTNGDKVSASVDIEVQGPPFEPAGVYVRRKGVTTTTVPIQFIPAGNNGETITSYVIETFNHWQGFWLIHETNVRPVDADNDIKRHTVRGLRPFSKYNFRVRAENKHGTSDPSVPSAFVQTDAVVPDRYPLQVGGGGGKIGELYITWQPMKPWEHNGEKFFYRVYYKTHGDKEFGERVVNVSASQSYVTVLVGQDNFYMLYDVAVQAYNEKGAGPMSPQVAVRSAMKLPSVAVENLQIMPFNSTACVVMWRTAHIDREKMGGKLGGYRAAYWEEAKYGDLMEDAPRVTVNGQVSEALVIGLNPDTVYMFGVYIWNQAGNGPISDTFPQRTLRQAPINQPVEVKVYQRSSSSIRVFWRGVSTTSEEEPLIGYKVRLWREGSDIKAADDYDAKKEVDLVIKDLNPLIHYKLRVFGFSRGGEGTMSSPAVEFMLGAAGVLAPSKVSVLLLGILTLLWRLL